MTVDEAMHIATIRSEYSTPEQISEACVMLAAEVRRLRETALPPAAYGDQAHIEFLAMDLAADENNDIHQLIWEGHPPEPWGDVWQKYESDARGMIERVFKSLQTSYEIPAFISAEIIAQVEALKDGPGGYPLIDHYCDAINDVLKILRGE